MASPTAKPPTVIEPYTKDQDNEIDLKHPPADNNLKIEFHVTDPDADNKKFIDVEHTKDIQVPLNLEHINKP